MVSSASSRPTPSSSSSSSSPSSTALAPSPSALQQLWSFLPFSFSSSSSPSSPSSLSHSSRSESTPPHKRACRSYCCQTLSASSFSLDSTQQQPRSNLRPKNYYSKRQRFMSNPPLGSHYHSSASSASHSDSGSERDETRPKNMATTRSHRSGSGSGLGSSAATASQPSHLHRRFSPTTQTFTPPSAAPSNQCSEKAISSNDYYKFSSSSSSSSNSSGTDSRTHSRQSSNKLGLVTEGPYLFVFDVALSLYYPIRALILFVLGFVFSLVIDHLQTQHRLVEYPTDISQLWDTASWLPPTCGASAVLIGTIYPLGDYLWWGKRVPRSSRDWSSVMRCMGGFIGVNYAASKLPWTSSLQVSCTLALISAGLWFLFDRTIHGFVISLMVASMGTAVAYFLVLNGWYSFTRADFFGVGSWMPCILYSSSVCFGSIGRQLDVVPETWYHSNHSSRVHLKAE
ncbi:Insulin-induced protein 2 protein [Mortierella alpina]|nr:Insulin-induced protein 2 protein [Mortierella alpina]